jgi:adenylylsulfate kinase
MSWTLWITGPPASGKSTLARGLAAALAPRGFRVVVLDLDDFRGAVAPAPSCRAADQRLVYRSLVWVARALASAGVPVVIDAIAPQREWRDLARSTLSRFAEVQLRCPPGVCRERQARQALDPSRSARPARPVTAAPGLDVPREAALAPELEIDTSREPPARAVERVLALAARLADLQAARPAAARAGWAIWITGRPGSGKTTIARAVAATLASTGIPAALLELADLGRFVVGDRAPTPDEDVVLHRVLVEGARRLTGAGVPVLIDATAPRRAWREQARQQLRPFAEVQLLCPADVCASRERAVRWGLGDAAAPPAGRPGAPAIVLEYEAALTPDVVIHTDVEDPWTSTETVLVLARRLHGTVAVTRESAWTPGASD